MIGAPFEFLRGKWLGWVSGAGDPPVMRTFKESLRIYGKRLAWVCGLGLASVFILLSVGIVRAVWSNSDGQSSSPSIGDSPTDGGALLVIIIVAAVIALIAVSSVDTVVIVEKKSGFRWLLLILLLGAFALFIIGSNNPGS